MFAINIYDVTKSLKSFTYNGKEVDVCRKSILGALQIVKDNHKKIQSNQITLQ